VLLPVVRSSHSVIAVEVTCTWMLDPVKIAAANVDTEAILLTRSSSSTSGDSLSREVDEDVEMSRLDVLLLALKDVKALTHRRSPTTKYVPHLPALR
jgi:hypothetical protein